MWHVVVLKILKPKVSFYFYWTCLFIIDKITCSWNLHIRSIITKLYIPAFIWKTKQYSNTFTRTPQQQNGGLSAESFFFLNKGRRKWRVLTQLFNPVWRRPTPVSTQSWLFGFHRFDKTIKVSWLSIEFLSQIISTRDGFNHTNRTVYFFRSWVH